MQMFNFDGQEDDQAKSFVVNLSLDGRFLAVIVTPNPSLSLSLNFYNIYKQFGSRSDPNENLEIMFRQFNLNIRACDRKHAKHQYCRLAKLMRTRSISKYHFQYRYVVFFEITRDYYATIASLSLLLFKVCR